MQWRKSSYSGGNGQCVEVGNTGRNVAVRDSKHPDGAKLAVRPEQWRVFVRTVKTR
jgi:hypothetical protein